MSVIEFKYLKVTTMTVICQLEGLIDVDKIFPLLPITMVSLEDDYNPKAKLQPTKNGDILSARYRGATRGVYRSGSFKNSILIDMSTNTKCVNFKASKDKIQMCGARSMEEFTEVVNTFLGHVSIIRGMVKLIQDDLEGSKLVCDEFISLCREQFYICQSKLCCRLVLPVYERPTLLQAYLLNQAESYSTTNDLRVQFDYILSIIDVGDDEVKIDRMQSAMVNYNYDIGFNVNRWNLSILMNEVGQFQARYDNTIQTYVSVQLPYEPSEDMIFKKKKGYYQTFTVYKSGKVTHSGPCIEVMEEAYNLFNAALNDIREHIEVPGVRKLTIRPRVD